MRQIDGPGQECEEMVLRMFTRSRIIVAAAVATLGWALNSATAGLPDVPPFLPPPPTVTQPPPVITPPPIHNPPPVHNAPEPATAVLGGIAAVIGGVIARRRKRA